MKQHDEDTCIDCHRKNGLLAVSQLTIKLLEDNIELLKRQVEFLSERRTFEAEFNDKLFKKYLDLLERTASGSIPHTRKSRQA